MEISSPLTDNGRYSARAILTCAAFLITPQPYTLRIRERAIYRRGEIERQVAVTSILPSLLFVDDPIARNSPTIQAEASPAGAVDGDMEDEIFPFPLLTPKKGELLTIHDVCSGDKARLVQLSHAEHSAVAKLMITEMLYAAGLVWLYLDFGHAQPELRRLRLALREIPDLSTEDSYKVLDEHFDSTTKQLRAYDGPIRSDYEARLFNLCEMLASRNIIIAETTAEVGSPFEIHYTQVAPYDQNEDLARTRGSSLRERFVEYAGGQPANLRLWAPLARRTDDYHFYMQAPGGFYFSRQLVFPSSSQERLTKVKSLPLLRHVRNERPQYQHRPGTPTEAHILVVDGTRATEPLDIGLTMFEAPLGSAGPAWVSSFSTSFLIGLLLLAKHLGGGTLGSASVPALLAAFVGSAISLTSALFGRKEDPITPVLSRVILLCCAAIGNIFAVWWLLNQNTHRQHNSVAQFLRIYGGYILLAASALVLGVATYRLRRVLSTYAKGVRT